MTEIQIIPLHTQRLPIKNWCYIVVHMQSKAAIFIDPSWEFDTIRAVVETQQLNPKAILLTHHHLDHTHLADKIARFYDIPAFIHGNEINLYQFSCFNLQKLPEQRPWTIDNILIEALKTPGHTIGCVCYYINDNLFTGDTLFNEGCGVCHGKGACANQMFDSLQELKQKLSDETLIYPGHVFRTPVGQTFAKVKESNIYLHIEDAQSFVEYRMRPQQRKMIG